MDNGKKQIEEDKKAEAQHTQKQLGGCVHIFFASVTSLIPSTQTGATKMNFIAQLQCCHANATPEHHNNVAAIRNRCGAFGAPLYQTALTPAVQSTLAKGTMWRCM